MTPAFVPGPPRPAGSTRDLVALGAGAPARRSRAGPAAGAAAVAALATRTPEGTAGIVSVLGPARDAAGRVWVRVRLPVLPNGTTGWVPRGALGGYGTVDTRLESTCGACARRCTAPAAPCSAPPSASGAPQWPTPRGRFYVAEPADALRAPAVRPDRLRHERPLARR